MKTTVTAASLFLAIGLTSLSMAQSTTGGKSGGSTASTGSGYLTEGQRVTTSSPNSMTIDDEGASRAYMYVPPTAKKNRSASPDGSGTTKSNSSAKQAAATGKGNPSSGKKKQ
ncbi:hypothetical protein [Spirosoma oryzicola]|uniref:hypothetical protein n=1 Tax=Spirosoma oryzicola TaxID=2898794 RepID=UPI001E31C949|nr:hypothetical protein [Spirosoma oryzicola]UHG89079.1 hypothetical protein LQ777_12570 [Spirosoma oryzicola]